MPPLSGFTNTLSIHFVQTRYDDEPEEYQGVKEDAWLKTHKYEIRRYTYPVARMIIFVIDPKHAKGKFRRLMCESCYSLRYFSLICSSDGRLLPDLKHEGTGVWDPDEMASDGDGRIAYLHQIIVDSGWRGKGIGEWSLKRIWELDEMKGIHFIFTRPVVIVEQDLGNTPIKCSSNHPFAEETNPGTDDAEYSPSDDGEKAPPEPTFAYIYDFFGSYDKNPSERVGAWLYKNAFRRVGNSAYLALSRSSTHPSRQIPYNADASFVRDLKRGEKDGLHVTEARLRDLDKGGSVMPPLWYAASGVWVPHVWTCERRVFDTEEEMDEYDQQCLKKLEGIDPEAADEVRRDLEEDKRLREAVKEEEEEEERKGKAKEKEEDDDNDEDVEMKTEVPSEGEYRVISPLDDIQ